MQKEFQTADIYLTSVISILLNEQPTFRVKNSRIIFCFPASDELYKAMNDYENGVSLNTADLINMIKKLRAEMMVRKKIENGIIPIKEASHHG